MFRSVRGRLGAHGVWQRAGEEKAVVPQCTTRIKEAKNGCGSRLIAARSVQLSVQLSVCRKRTKKTLNRKNGEVLGLAQRGYARLKTPVIAGM